MSTEIEMQRNGKANLNQQIKMTRMSKEEKKGVIKLINQILEKQPLSRDNNVAFERGVCSDYKNRI